MKKILSIILAVAFIFAAMSISVFAATSEHVVGHEATPGTTNTGTSYTDGADNFDSATNSQNISIGFNRIDDNGTPDDTSDDTPVNVIHHKYAVDIEYNDLVIDMTKILDDMATQVTPDVTTDSYKFVWNVNTHKYDLVVVNGGTETVATVVTQGTLVYRTPYTIKAYRVINHSDLGIKYSDEINSTNTDNYYHLSWASSIDNAAGLTDDECVPVSKATASDNEFDGTATYSPDPNDGHGDWNEITATPKDEKSWLDVVNAWGANNAENTFVIATLTVTVKPNPAT